MEHLAEHSRAVIEWPAAAGKRVDMGDYGRVCDVASATDWWPVLRPSRSVGQLPESPTLVDAQPQHRDGGTGVPLRDRRHRKSARSRPRMRRRRVRRDRDQLWRHFVRRRRWIISDDRRGATPKRTSRRFAHPRTHRGLPRPARLVRSRCVQMALHYIDDLDAVLQNVHNVLVPGGRLIFTVVHPVITSTSSPNDGPRTDYTVDRYFERGARERQWFGSTVTWHHRTVEDYLTAVQRCGLDFVSLRECEPNLKLLADRPEELERRRRVPLMLLISARRPSG